MPAEARGGAQQAFYLPACICHSAFYDRDRQLALSVEASFEAWRQPAEKATILLLHAPSAVLALWPASSALLAAAFLLLLRRRREAYARWRELLPISGAAHCTTVIAALGGCCLAAWLKHMAAGFSRGLAWQASA